MTIIDMLGQSRTLTLLGMAVVFGFLTIMVISISLLGKLIRTLGADKGEAAPQTTNAQSANAGGAVTAAVSAAVNEYRKTNS
ncbi:MAG: OadG family protein [Treponema sp.]|jgi:oxaloacetate decarboxylase gamma subunit|nr:OadG family protein [Treponema sp.]